jgi:hypothetical protein
MSSKPMHEPPTSEEMLAYLRGEMSAADEETFRERLMPYPELVRTLTAEFPCGAQPGDEDYLSDAEFEKHWAQLQQRAPRGSVVSFWPSAMAIAASLAALVLGLLYWRAVEHQREPRVLSVSAQPLMPDSGERGNKSEPAVVTPTGDTYSLAPVLMDQRPFDGYRVELFDAGATPQRSLWSTRAPQPHDDATLMITVPRAFIQPGLYRLAVYGISGGNEEHLHDYTVRVE